jgi:hypothetical protein
VIDIQEVDCLRKPETHSVEVENRVPCSATALWKVATTAAL